MTNNNPYGENSNGRGFDGQGSPNPGSNDQTGQSGQSGNQGQPQPGQSQQPGSSNPYGGQAPDNQQYGAQPGQPGQSRQPNQPYGAQPGQPGQPGQLGQAQPGQGQSQFNPPYGAQPGQPGQQGQGNPYGAQPGQPGQASFSSQPGQPGQPNQSQPYGSQFGGAQPTGGGQNGSGKAAGLIIGALVLIIALIAGAYFLFVNDDKKDDADPATSTTNSSAAATSDPTTTSDSSSSSSTSSSSTGIASPDGSMPAAFKTSLPHDLTDWVHKCEEVEFTLDYEELDKPDRPMNGSSCKGSADSPFTYSTIDFIDDKEYADNVVDRTHAAKKQLIASDESNDFAAISGKYDSLNNLVIVNPEEGKVMEVQYATEEKMRKALTDLGYQVP